MCNVNVYVCICVLELCVYIANCRATVHLLIVAGAVTARGLFILKEQRYWDRIHMYIHCIRFVNPRRACAAKVTVRVHIAWYHPVCGVVSAYMHVVDSIRSRAC